MNRQDGSADIENMAICVVQQARLHVLASRASLADTSAHSSIFYPLHAASIRLQQYIRSLSAQHRAELSALVESLIATSFAERYSGLECLNCSRTYYHRREAPRAARCEPPDDVSQSGLPCDYYEPSIVTHNEDIKEIRLVLGQLTAMGVNLNEAGVISSIRQVSRCWLEKLELLVDT